MLLSQFQTIGRELSARGLVTSHSGNLSVRFDERMVITRRGSMLGSLTEQDLIETGVIKNDRFTPLASSELQVHRAIYQATNAQAVIHSHPPHANALSLVENEIVPKDEWLQVIGRVPVVGWGQEMKPGGFYNEIAKALQGRYVVMLYGHGSFAIGQLLEDAFSYTTVLEEAAKVLCLLKSLHSSNAGKEPGR